METGSIEEFKAVLQGGGVRPTMFQVEMTFPDAVVVDPTQADNEGTYLIKARVFDDSGRLRYEEFR